MTLFQEHNQSLFFFSLHNNFLVGYLISYKTYKTCTNQMYSRIVYFNYKLTISLFAVNSVEFEKL